MIAIFCSTKPLAEGDDVYATTLAVISGSIPTVSPTRLLSELETVAARLGIALRVEPFGDELLGARGGLCRLRERPLILIDAALPVPDRISVLAGALSAFDMSSI